MEQLKPKDLVGMWERSRAIGKRETEAHFNQERGYLQQRVPRISVHHTNGIPWAWASTLHRSDIPKLNARPGMAQYSPGITDDHICILPCQRVFHFQPCPCQNLLSENTFSLLLLFLHLQYAKSLFLSTLFPPRGRSGEGGVNSPAVTYTSIFLSCRPAMYTSYSSLQNSIFNYTFLFLTFLCFQYTYCYVSRETLVCTMFSPRELSISVPFLPPVFSHQLALGTYLIQANVSPAEIQKVSIFLFTVEQNCWHFSIFPFSTFLGNLKMMTILSSKGGDLQEHVTLDVLWFSKGKAETHLVLEKPEWNWIKLSRSPKWHLKASHCFC